MTVWPDADAARIDPKILDRNTSTLSIRLIHDAYRTFDDESKSEAYKLGYLHQTLQLLEKDIRHRIAENSW
jgi:hypothetical protein